MIDNSSLRPKRPRIAVYPDGRAKLMTAQELFRLPGSGYDPKHTELVYGVLVVNEPSGVESSSVSLDIAIALGTYVNAHDLGKLTGEAGGYVLARNPDLVRSPDIGFIQKSRVPKAGLPKFFFDGPPDLAVEVISPTDKRKKLHEKVEQYLTSGTRLVWVIDPAHRTVVVHRPGCAPRSLGNDESLDGEDVIPGFLFPVASIFPAR